MGIISIFSSSNSHGLNQVFDLIVSSFVQPDYDTESCIKFNIFVCHTTHGEGLAAITY